MLSRILLTFCLVLPSAVIADGVEALKRYYRDVQSLSGDFTQITRTDAGRVIEESSGRMMIQRPDRFRWLYSEPFEQTIVADGKRLWVYDVDLEQVTARPLDQVLGVGPALLLSGDFQSLDAAFDIVDEGGGWVRLTPISGDWDFQSVRLKLEKGAPRVVTVDSGFGQTTELKLENLELNPELSPEEFEFKVPKGVDVIGAVSGNSR